MSCGLPAASFDTIKSSLEIKDAARPLTGSIADFNTPLPCTVKIDAADFR